MWTIDEARDLAGEHLSALGDRWRHVLRVGSLAELLIRTGRVDEVVGVAAWLHDLGYAPQIERTGFHPIDGAEYLRAVGAPYELVGLVARHTGASYEAEERGLVAQLAALPEPSAGNLDVVTLIDLSVGPDGSLTTPGERVEEIRSRYDARHPAHRAVARARGELLASAARAREQLALPDDWPIRASEGVSDTETHGRVQL